LGDRESLAGLRAKKRAELIKIFIDGKPLEVKEGLTVLEVSKQAGIHIPHFCYHSAFEPVGSCRMCLVGIEGFPKLELACSTVVRQGMKISTASEEVADARRGVLEFLLADHPLDCPICDKSGECKLQDYYEKYGRFEGQFKESKEKREKTLKTGKYLILDRERCILCTRCVRFLDEITKTHELGVFNRGNYSEIGIYENDSIDNNYSGNIAEICPVGAFTDADFRFKMRKWFLEKGASICPLCGRGCNIFIEYHPGFSRIPQTQRVYRVKARENPEVNGHWICDMGRYGYFHLDQNRWDNPVMHEDDKGTKLSWEEALILLAEKIRTLVIRNETSQIAVVANTYFSNEELFLFHKIFRNDLKLDKVFFMDPPPGNADTLLLTAERSPNRKGAQIIGFDLTPPTLEAITRDTDLLLVFGLFLLDHFDAMSVKNALSQIGTKFLFTPHASDLNILFDIVLPVALIAEKNGSLTNINGVVQKFKQVLKPLGESRPEWRLLTDLAKELKMNFEYYGRLTAPDVIFQEMAKEMLF
jgi:NADH-quinone oxidoreductase subunit G